MATARQPRASDSERPVIDGRHDVCPLCMRQARRRAHVPVAHVAHTEDESGPYPARQPRAASASAAYGQQPTSSTSHKDNGCRRITDEDRRTVGQVQDEAPHERQDVSRETRAQVAINDRCRAVDNGSGMDQGVMNECVVQTG